VESGKEEKSAETSSSATTTNKKPDTNKAYEGLKPLDFSNKNKPTVTWERTQEAYDKINGGKWSVGGQVRKEKGIADGFTEAEISNGQWLINLVYEGKTFE
jgi:hypothetical protein